MSFLKKLLNFPPFKIITKNKEEILSLAFLCIFIFLSAKALFHPGFFRTIDDITTVRIVFLKKELERGEWLGNFPVRWASELSHKYGYPLYLFYSPLTYYVGALIMIIGGLSHIVATKWVYVFPLLVGPFLFYWCARQKFSIFPSLVSSCFYALFPFRGYDTYIRGGVGEAWSMAFLPGMVGGLFLLNKKNKIGGLLFAFFLFLIIISHNISGLLAISLSLAIGLFFFLKNKDFWKFFVLGILMACFFWLPSLFYLRSVRVLYSPQNTGEVLNFLVPFKSILKINFPILPEDRFSGIFFYFLAIALVIFLVKKENLRILERKDFLFWLTISIFLYFLLSDISFILWKITLHISRMLQFPWRVLIILSISLPIVIGFCIKVIRSLTFKIFLFIAILFSVFNFLPAFKPKEYSFFYEYSAEDTGPCATSWGEEYLPLWVKECPDKPPLHDLEVTGNSQLKILYNNLINIEALVSSEKEEDLIVNKYYFPGWKILIDGKNMPLNFNFSKKGIFKTKIPAGEHRVKVLLTKTKIMWLADVVSLFSFLTFFTLLFKYLLIRVSKNKV